MSAKLNENAALILIDIQDGFDDAYWGKRNNKDAELVASKILHKWREQKLPVFHVQHLSTEENSPLRPDRPGSAIKAIVSPIAGEEIITKNVNSAFIGTDLEKKLRAANITDVILCGLTTDHCVSTSTRMAGNLGFRAFIVTDATATFEKTGPDGRLWSADDIHSSALASLHKEFATALKSAELLELIPEKCETKN